VTTIFLFAHQDDEIGVFHVLADAKRRGQHVACLYLTDGAWGGGDSAQRNAESRSALKSIGLTENEIRFLGTDIPVPDGKLVENLDRCFDAICAFIDDLARSARPVRRVVMHAWEGGHQDHDAAHILGVAIAGKYRITPASRQFPLYRMPATRWTMTFAAPLDSNGAVETTLIPLSKRLRYLRLLTHYRSQKRVMMKLLPHLLKDYAAVGVQRLQPISLARLRDDPNIPPMLYEVWKLYSYARFRQFADAFIATNVGLQAAPLSSQGNAA
jgi:N-acetylglucosamine malate deacetylase 1